jgi:hypothetical protein
MVNMLQALIREHMIVELSVEMTEDFISNSEARGEGVVLMKEDEKVYKF